MGEDDYDWGYGYGADTVDQWNQWIDNGDGSFTDPNTGDVWANGQIVGWDYQDGSGAWVDNEGNVFDADGILIGWDVGDGFVPLGDGNGGGDAPAVIDISDLTDRGDGTWHDAQGVIYDADRNVVGFDGSVSPVAGYAPVDVPAAPASGGFWAGVKSFFSGLTGGASGGSGGGSGGGFSGGGMSSSQQQKANETAQQLRQAQQSGASAAQIAALQAQLARDIGAARGMDWTPILIAGGAALAIYAITNRRARD